jgi:hypothetical protein
MGQPAARARFDFLGMAHDTTIDRTSRLVQCTRRAAGNAKDGPYYLLPIQQVERVPDWEPTTTTWLLA